MPFDRNGVWHNPTSQDLENFRRQLTEKEAVTGDVTPAMVKALSSLANPTAMALSSNAELFNAISRLEGAVDIVIPVYAGLHVLKPCIDSILARTSWPFRLIVVDDCSPDPVTIEYLESIKHHGVTVLFNNNNRGFAASVNRGVAAGDNPYVVVLNSDTLVTDNWLTKMLIALESNPLNVICNPATNNTAMINVNMYTGRSYLDMADAMDKMRNIKYPDAMPTGFCFMFRRALWNVVGPFDEAYVSYGEESDFWFKAIRLTDEDGVVMGYRGVLADNAYVYHERGTSFSQLGVVAHKKQRDAGSARFKLLHPEFTEWAKGYRADDCIGHVRTGIPDQAFPKFNDDKNVAWVVKSTDPCGGMFFIADIANQMIEDGYNVKICVIPDRMPAEGQELPSVGNLHCQPILFSSGEEFLATFEQRCFSKGTVLAAVTELTPTVYQLGKRNEYIKVFNHVQSWDVALAEAVGKPEFIPQFVESYKRVPNIVSSGWVAEEIKNIGGKVVDVVRPGVNPLLFHNRYRDRHDDRFTIGIMLLRQYPYKGFDKGVEICRQLTDRIKNSGAEIRIVAIGVDALPAIPGVVCVGPVSQSKMADLLGNEIDVLIDPASVHSYGLPILEALISGCRAISFNNRGVNEYQQYWGKRLAVVDTEAEVADVAFEFWASNDSYKREVTRSQVEYFSRGAAIEAFIRAIFPPQVEKISHRIEVVTPHLRKHGGPTTNIALANSLAALGHKVTMSMVYADWNPEVFNFAKVKIRTKWEKVPSDAKVCIINSDNPFAARIMEANQHCKYIMYKLSHNARFKKEESDNLNLPWNHIITSTSWLKQACHELVEGWEHNLWPDEKVTVVGWYHYGHANFNCDPRNRTYGDAQAGFRIGTLVHHHPLKGTQEAIAALNGVKKKYGNYAHAVGVGEQKAKVPPWMQFLYSPNRADMAHIFRQLDIWFGASHTEGLGRMALEAMSSGLPVVTTNTGAEIFVDGENCLLYPVGDAQAGAECIDRLVQDRGLMSKLAINGYDTARRMADPEPFRNKANEVVLGVINEG